MHKTYASMKAILVITGVVLLLQQINAEPQRGSPPQGYYGRQPNHSKPMKQNSGTKIIGWLGSQMAKLPGFRTSLRPPGHPKYKKNHAHLPPQAVVFSNSLPPAYGFGGGASINSIPGVDVSHIYYPSPSPPSSSMYSQVGDQFPQQSYISSPSYASPTYSSPVENNNPMSPQNTIFQVISADGTSRYQKTPPPGYENFFGQQGTAQFAAQGAPPPPPTSQFAMQQPPRQQMPSQQQVIYQYQNAPGRQPLHSSQSSGNIELIPSKMVSYNKETISTGHPEYQAAVDGMSTSASSHYQSAVHYRPTYAPQANDYYRGQQVQSLNSNLGTMFNGVATQVAPIYDLASLEAQQSQQQQNYAPPQKSMESYLNQADTQTEYSHPSQVSVPAPANFQDMQTSESNNQVHILAHGAQDGNPTFEVLADANAPTYDGGHPFDINQLISMIEPGAQVDLKDILSQDQEGVESQNYADIAQPPNVNNGIKNSDFSSFPKVMNSGFTPIISNPSSSHEKLNDSPNPITHLLQKGPQTQRPPLNDKPSNASKIKFPDNDSDTRDSFQPLEQPPILLSIATTQNSKIIYHTVQPQINKHSTNFNSMTKDLTKNHNYNGSNYTISAPFKSHSTNQSVSQVFPLNPLFDSVLSKENEFFPDSEESRQVYQYSITVTPPPSMFKEHSTPLTNNAITRISSPQIISSSTQIIEPKPLKKYPVYLKKH